MEIGRSALDHSRRANPAELRQALGWQGPGRLLTATLIAAGALQAAVTGRRSDPPAWELSACDADIKFAN